MFYLSFLWMGVIFADVEGLLSNYSSALQRFYLGSGSYPVSLEVKGYKLEWEKYYSSSYVEIYRGKVKRGDRDLLREFKRTLGGDISNAWVKVERISAEKGGYKAYFRIELGIDDRKKSIYSVIVLFLDRSFRAYDLQPEVIYFQVSKVERFFLDVTPVLFGREGSYREQLYPGLPFFWRFVDSFAGITFRGYQGVALGDVDGDYVDDLYVAQPGGLPDLLYLKEGIEFKDISKRAGIDFIELTISAIFVDLDGDGDSDLLQTRTSSVVIFENMGARFIPKVILPIRGAVGVAPGDFDGDGFIDLYLYAYRNPDEGEPPTPYYDAKNGERNKLYRNLGNFKFVDVTDNVVLGVGNQRFTFAASWEDFDNDGDLDLYVVNDFGRNNLYRNEGGFFVDVASVAGVEDMAAGMGVSWGDFNRDGNIDIYVSNMDSSAGGRVVGNTKMYRRFSEEVIRKFVRHARGNTLFRNNGDGTFSDVSENMGVHRALWSWGSLFVDLDNDGFKDIVAPNGYLTGEKIDDL